jgi:hypothetical protein
MSKGWETKREEKQGFSLLVSPVLFLTLLSILSMTLTQFFSYSSENPWPIALFFIFMPIAAWLVGQISDGSKEVKFWSYVYAVLVYTVCIPGIFALTLNAYLFLFERQSVWQANIILQFLPVISMAISLMLIKSKIPFDVIPGFGQISGFLGLIFALIGLMWFLDRIHLVAFTYVPFSVITGGFVLTLLAIRFAWSRLF